MEKDFDEWNNEKKELHIYGGTINYENLFIKPRQVRYIKLGKNIGVEINGKQQFKRPILVMKKIGSLFLGLPLTTKIKHTVYYHSLHTWSGTRKSSIVLSQIRTFDKKRFVEHIGHISTKEFLEIKKHLKEFYFSDASL